MTYTPKFPDVGRGIISYKWKDQDLSIDLSKVRFDWDKMSNTEEADSAIANLMYSVAMVCTADFGTEETCGRYDTYRLFKSFYYKNTMKYLTLAETSLSNFEETIYEDLCSNRPVLFHSYSSSDDVGHLMVIDGYNSQTELFHINFGWGGYADGYYMLTKAQKYDSQQAILYHIEPDYGVPIESGLYPPTNFSLNYDLNNLYKWNGKETEIDMNADGAFWNVKTINSSAFENNTTLRIINLPIKLEEIANRAFNGCSELETVYLPSYVSKVSGSSFYNCENLTNFIVSEDNALFYGNNGMLFNREKNSVVACGGGVKGKVLIPNGISLIENNAFEKGQINAVDLPSSLTSIGEYAFAGCKNLTTVTIPGGVDYIGSCAFSECSSLTQVVSLAITPPNMGNNPFEGLDCSEITLCVPEESVNDYRKQYGWNKFTTIVGVAEPKAKKLLVFTTDGSIKEIFLSQNPHIKNNGTELEIKYGANTISFEGKMLLKMMFMNENEDVSSIEKIENRDNWQREVINFSQLPPRSVIEIYDISGKLLKKERVGETSKSLSLKELGKGIFLIRINGVTYKVSRQ